MNKKPLIYLASPYSHADQAVIEDRVYTTQKVTARLIEQGHLIFSPIVHTHPIANMVSFAPVNTSEAMSPWMQYDTAMIDKCDELWVLCLPGWELSRGVEAEINHALSEGKTLRYFDYPSLREIGSLQAKFFAEEAHTTYAPCGIVKDYLEATYEGGDVVTVIADSCEGDPHTLPVGTRAVVTDGRIDKDGRICINADDPNDPWHTRWVLPTDVELFTEEIKTTSLPDDAEARNDYPMADGLLYYFPNALAEVSKISALGAKQHGLESMHWSRGKSTDHANKIIRHLVDAGKTDAKGVRHSANVAWRALALLQEELERDLGLPMPPNAWVDEV